MIDWHLEKRQIADLKPCASNPRQLSEREFAQLSRSLDSFGLIDKPIINADNGIIGGHQRLAVLSAQGQTEVECWVPERVLTEDEYKELVIRLNRNVGSWDWDILANDWEVEDLLGWGFEPGELGLIGDEIDEIEVEDPADSAPEPPSFPITQPGDVIQLDGHRLICGDCREAHLVAKLFEGQTADMVLTDPPYGVNYAEKNDHLRKFGRGKKHEAITSDVNEDYRGFFAGFLALVPWSEYNTCYVFMSGQELHNLRLAMEDCGMKWSDYLVWVKNNLVLGRKDYNAKHEFVAYGWKGKHKFYGPTNSTTVLEFSKPQANKLHPTMKPVELLRRLLTDGSEKAALVYDPFLGSGSTMMASEAEGRQCYGFELMPAYCDVIVNRFLELRPSATVLVNGKEGWEAKSE